MKNRIISIVLALFIFISAGATILALGIKPITLNRKVFTYEYGSTISRDPTAYITANASVLAKTSINLDEVENKIGSYQAYVKYLNKKYYFTIVIEDTTKPVLTIKKNLYYVDLKTTLVAKDLVDEVTDNSKVNIYFLTDDNKKVKEKTFSKAGTYILSIIGVDSSGNETAKYRIKVIAAVNGVYPYIEGIDAVEIIKGKAFDPLEGVRAYDGKGKEITSKIKILKNNVNVNKIGVYEVIYSVTNSQGNTYQRSRKVAVISKS